MRVLVTGATGFVGRAVTAVLAYRGYDVVALTRSAREVRHASEVRRADLADTGAIHSAIADIDAVCHLAAVARVRDSIAHPLDYWRTNTVGTINVLGALRERAKRDQPKRLVLASSAAVYGIPATQPIAEEAPPDPRNPYGTSKLAADLAAADVAATGAIGAVSLRAFNIAGASEGMADGDLTRLIPKILAVQAGLAPELVINGDGAAIRDFVHVLDMAEAFVLALEACEPGQWRAYNVGSGRQTRISDVVSAAENVTGRPVPVCHAPPAQEPPVLLADSTRLGRELGWQPRNSDLSQILTDGWNALSSKYSAEE